jgi:hypothetical protein
VLACLYAVPGLLGAPARVLGPRERRHRPLTESSVAPRLPAAIYLSD